MKPIDLMRRMGEYAHIPLLEAGKAGLIDLVMVTDPKASLPFGRMRRAERARHGPHRG